MPARQVSGNQTRGTCVAAYVARYPANLAPAPTTMADSGDAGAAPGVSHNQVELKRRRATEGDDVKGKNIRKKVTTKHARASLTSRLSGNETLR